MRAEFSSQRVFFLSSDTKKLPEPLVTYQQRSIYLRVISQEVLIHDMCSVITFIRLLQHLTGVYDKTTPYPTLTTQLSSVFLYIQDQDW